MTYVNSHCGKKKQFQQVLSRNAWNKMLKILLFINMIKIYIINLCQRLESSFYLAYLSKTTLIIIKKKTLGNAYNS